MNKTNKVKNKGKCLRCGKKASYWELLRYNGICALCFVKEANSKKRKPQL